MRPSSDRPSRAGKSAFISSQTNGRRLPLTGGPALKSLVTLDNSFCRSQGPGAGDASFKRLPYQLSMVRDLPTMVVTGDGESGFDSGEGA